ncbi:UNVERIFIED_CONTAM: hypothetical protein K2H54_063308, partial [Gekko kuhli]
PWVAKPHLISWLEKEEEVFVHGHDEGEGLAAGGVWESVNETKAHVEMTKEKIYSDAKENTEYCDTLRKEEDKHTLKGINISSLLQPPFILWSDKIVGIFLTSSSRPSHQLGAIRENASVLGCC